MTMTASKVAPFWLRDACAMAATAVLLAGCGGGASSPSTPGTPSTPNTPVDPLTPPNPNVPPPDWVDVPTTKIPYQSNGTVDYYGDSTIYGYRTHVGGQVATPAPAAFYNALPPERKYTVRNEGVSSTDACQLRDGTDGVHPAWTQQMQSSPAQIVIISFGINDQWRFGVDQFKDCLTDLVNGARSAGKYPVLETPNPTRDSGAGGLDAYATAMREVASTNAVRLIDQYAYLTNYLGGRNPTEICPDGLHPTEEVYIMKGEYAADRFVDFF